MINYLPPRASDYYSILQELYPEEIMNGRRVRDVTFQLTEDCCMACTYCYQHNKSKKKLTFETAKIFIDNLLNNKYETMNTSNTFAMIFAFIGGEPLLEAKLMYEICDYAVKQMINLHHPWLPLFRISISSNGLLYHSEDVQKFLNKFGEMTSYSISIDGNKELHDSCRVDLEGKGTYDRAISAAHEHEQKFGHIPSTKMTLAPENIKYLYDATINLINEGYTEILLNCVFENVWNLQMATIYYNQLKQVADYFINNNLYNKIYYRLFDERNHSPLSEDDNNNWCGGTTDCNLALDPDGNLYPCIRYMASSLNGKQKPLIIGDLVNGYDSLEVHHNNVKLLDNITRRSQSTDECFYCPIGKGCAWCSGYNYEEFGTPNKRATYICCMHKAESLANVYYWNTLYQKLGIDKTFEMHIPKEWALEIIDENEYNMLYELSNKNASQL